ncbi:MAG: carboxylating nicotinate-nucleotide diphosphorylase [Acidimicrobiaceae bacterium]|nr:carboxylating nicotinate-nucleotide diphosphorylase [Ilumatobacter sp.]MCB9379965.1 carboxylating nicotinate-nucleotide diphosphorylase [Acidimicrobiaceae bacterium]MCO5331868.1 carboxylating nicotinate-nucleotide diphosphorylase [Ilumatobacteraceae bacterium]
MSPAAPHPLVYDDLLRTALREDLGLAGDLTAEATVGADRTGSAVVRAREPGVVAGLEVVARLFAIVDPAVEVRLLVADGDAVAAGTDLATLRGAARSILLGERTALNLLGRLCGIATATRSVVDAIAGTRATVTCTRKTTPGLRGLEKYAVRVGGGANHRFGLDDAVLVKDNHIAFAGGLRAALEGIAGRVGHLVPVEVEVDTEAQLDELLLLVEHGHRVDVVMLDNFSPERLQAAVRRIGGRLVVEASGGITLERAREVAETGVDVLSLGWLTHSVPALDVGLDVVPANRVA